MLKISNNSGQKPPIELLKKSILIDELHGSYFPAFLYDKNNNKFLVTENEIKKVITVTKKLKWFIYVQKIQGELLIDLGYQPIDNNQIINCIALEEKEVNINFAGKNWEVPRIEMPTGETVGLCHLDLDKHILSRFQLNGEPKMVIAILEDGKTVFVKGLGPCFLNPEDKKNLWVLKLENEDVLVTNRSKDGTKVEVKTLDGRNLGRFYFNPEDSTKISGFQLNGENVRVYNFSDDGTKAEAVNLKEGQYLGRCSFDPNDNILGKFQLNGEDIIVTSISKYGTKAHVKTLDLKSLGLYLFDPKDNKKLWPLRTPPQTIASNLSKQLSDYGEKRYELKRNYK